MRIIDIIVDDYYGNLVDSKYASKKIMFRALHNKKYTEQMLYNSFKQNMTIVNNHQELIEVLTKIKNDTNDLNSLFFENVT
jgi:5'(3')-deoxyribonucleotidase